MYAGGSRSRASVAVTPFSVERERDPPATRGDGALAIVSACQLPRRRGRTPLATACAAHFVRGICRYGGRRRMRTDIPSTNYPLPTAIFRSNGRVALVATVAVTPFSVERERDPPASASGRRGLRPSRDTWRWRPRHRICLPAAATARRTPLATACAAHFVRGICRYDKLSNNPMSKCNRKS